MNYNLEEIIAKAEEGRSHAYVPYSKFKVGAAIYLKNGSYILGCNVENSSYGLTNCAERTAMFKMVSEGYSKEDVIAMCITGQTDTPISPCGACRQVMGELLNMDTPIILTNLKHDTKITTVEELLPYAFSKDDLK